MVFSAPSLIIHDNWPFLHFYGFIALDLVDLFNPLLCHIAELLVVLPYESMCHIFIVSAHFQREVSHHHSIISSPSNEKFLLFSVDV